MNLLIFPTHTSVPDFFLKNLISRRIISGKTIRTDVSRWSLFVRSRLVEPREWIRSPPSSYFFCFLATSLNHHLPPTPRVVQSTTSSRCPYPIYPLRAFSWLRRCRLSQPSRHQLQTCRGTPCTIDVALRQVDAIDVPRWCSPTPSFVAYPPSIISHLYLPSQVVTGARRRIHLLQGPAQKKTPQSLGNRVTHHKLMVLPSWCSYPWI